MGYVKVKGKISDTAKSKSLDIELIADTGAIYTAIPESSIPLLGVTTLELLGLQVDPITGELKPVELLLL